MRVAYGGRYQESEVQSNKKCNLKCNLRRGMKETS